MNDRNEYDLMEQSAYLLQQNLSLAKNDPEYEQEMRQFAIERLTFIANMMGLEIKEKANA